MKISLQDAQRLPLGEDLGEWVSLLSLAHHQKITLRELEEANRLLERPELLTTRDSGGSEFVYLRGTRDERQTVLRAIAFQRAAQGQS